MYQKPCVSVIVRLNDYNENEKGSYRYDINRPWTPIY